MPQVAIAAISTAYSQQYAQVHRGLHYLSNQATDNYEGVRGIVARFLGAASENEIILNSDATEGMNIVAYGRAVPRMQDGYRSTVQAHCTRQRCRGRRFG